MGCFLKYHLPLNEIICTECRSGALKHHISNGNANIIYNVSVPSGEDTIQNSHFTVEVDVKKIKWKKERKGLYSAMAQMYVVCPKCDKLHEIDKIIKTPKLYFEQTCKCEVCGGRLLLQGEEIEIQDRNGKPFVHLIGKLICEKCQNESSLSTNSEAQVSDNDNIKSSYVVAFGKGQELHIEL